MGAWEQVQGLLKDEKKLKSYMKETEKIVKSSYPQIAPIKKNQNKENFLDFLGKSLSTGAYTLSKLGTGALQGAENIGDATLHILGKGISGWQSLVDKEGAKKTEEFFKKAAEVDTVDILFDNHIDKVYGSNSYGKELIDNIAGGIGEMIPSVILGGGVSKALQGSKILATMSTKGKALSKTANMISKTGGMLPFMASATGSSINKALDEGAEYNEALKYGIMSGTSEGAIEGISGGIGGLAGKGINGLLNKNIVNKVINTTAIKEGLSKLTNTAIGKAGVKIGDITINGLGEGVEEVASAILNPYLQRLTYDEQAELASSEELMENFTMGVLTSVLFQGGASLLQKPRNKQKNDNNNKLLSETNKMAENRNLEQMEQLPKTDNEKINNFRETVSKYLKNDEKTTSFTSTVEKVIQDKKYNVLLDDTIGNDVNGKISTLENGEIEIKINPKSERAGEFILMHEITHAIETKEINDLIMDYASKHTQFSTALDDLKKIYKTEDISTEVVADISGQLFGNQEFINNLSMEKPSIFKRIYNKIVDIANKITGNSNEALFIRNLKNKWETAYRTQNNNMQNNSEYSIAGKKGMENAIKYDANNIALKMMYDRAIKLKHNGVDNETIRKQTDWFQDKNGYWKFEFTDKHMSLKSNIDLKPNRVYKLGNILKHDTLFMAYPELKNYIVKTSEMNANGSFNNKYKRIRINNNLTQDNQAFEGTLIHEIQHAIQHIEDFETGRSSKKSKLAYLNSLGEIEATETKNRFYAEKYNHKNINNIAPESSKINPQHAKLNAYLKNRGIIDKVKDSVYNYFNNKRGGNDDVFEENFKKNKEDVSKHRGENNRLVDGGRRIINQELDNSSSFSMKNQNWEEYIEQNYKATGTRTNLKKQLAPLPQNSQEKSEQLGAVENKKTGKEEEKIAQILTETPTQENKDQRIFAKFMAGIIDKGAVFEDLSIKNKNRNLIAKWDYMLTSEARAQNVMLNGFKEFDNKTKTEKQVSKSLIDIRSQVESSGKTKEFSEYLYHKHNIDRMKLEERANIKAQEIKNKYAINFSNEEFNSLVDEEIMSWARKRKLEKYDETDAEMIKELKELLWLEKMKNKPVFGYSVTADKSKAKVNKYEMDNPEFIEWAKDVYDYNNANLKQLVKNGVISQETAKYFNETYPHYVPINRANKQDNAISVPLDTNKTSVNAPIHKATGGNGDILPLFDTMARRTLQTFKATAKNNFGVELKNILKSEVVNKTTNVNETLDNVDNQDELLKEGKNGKLPTFTVFENGEKVTYEITKDMYDALKPVSDSSILSTTIKPLNAMSNFQRGVLTEYNPLFMLTNGIKDSQDVLINSQHPAKTYAKFPEAIKQMKEQGYWYKEYMANGGEQNSYFDSQEGKFESENKRKKITDLYPLRKISELNKVIEMAPRLAEYIASREQGRNIETSMLDAARVTTNFKAGGDITKLINRNGVTFLNASIQGAMQQVRNIREANMNGLKGYANLALRFTLAGVPAIILNSILFGDDKEYEDLSSYVKTNYWIVGKYGDGNFIRIPKGRMVTVIQESFNQMKNLITGDDEVDLGMFLETIANNIGPNNPIENNVLSPLVQAVSNKTWYGDDLVPKRLQNVPKTEQYDETIDKFSIELGKRLGISPYKINYVLDQYSGGIGDVVLPMMTSQAENASDNIAGKLIAPLTNKFSVDSVMKNQNVSDLYSLSDKLTVNANASNATDEDILKNKYINSVKLELSDLYKQKREIQSSNLSDKEKYNKARNIQKEINKLSESAISSYEDLEIIKNYASVGDKEYYKNDDDEWQKVSDKEKEKQVLISNMFSFKASDYYNVYKTYTSEIKEIQEKYKGTGTKYSTQKKKEIISKINSYSLNIPQKAMLIKQYYSSYNDYDEQIVKYINSQKLNIEQKSAILTELGLKVKNGKVVY